ncbi:MAG: YHS domain-containing protein [Limnochordaceae bacterium]|nr:YHS domain-containing protein [Limnochordaceae bacterium]
MARTRCLPCGMEIEPSEAKATSQYQGRTYYFCSTGCKTAFDRDPGRYAGGAGGEGESSRHQPHGHHHGTR